MLSTFQMPLIILFICLFDTLHKSRKTADVCILEIHVISPDQYILFQIKQSLYTNLTKMLMACNAEMYEGLSTMIMTLLYRASHM